MNISPGGAIILIPDPGKPTIVGDIGITKKHEVDMKHVIHSKLFKPLVLCVIITAVCVTFGSTWARQSSTLEQLGLLVDIRHELVSEYVEEPDQDLLVESAIFGMIESLEDPYTVYFPQEELESFEKQVLGTFSGIGAEIDIHDDRLRIVTPLEDSPAWRSGVMAGDIVLEIEGASTEGIKITEAVDKLTGEEGTDVTILVRHESGEEELITITRAIINIQTVRGFRRGMNQHYDFMMDHDNRIGYIRLTQFTESTVDTLHDALEALISQDVRGLVLDVRYNGGGLLDAAVRISDMFLEGGHTIVSVKGRQVEEQVYSSTDQTLLPEVPLVILANEASASASEIVTGAIAENGRGLFVGTRTFGKGSVQQVRKLEGGQGAIKMTNAYYYLPTGRNIHRKKDAEVWGVDPSEGSYVPMDYDERTEMIKIRRESDKVKDTNGDEASLEVTPEWIETELHDKQLAAALEAIMCKLETGEWPKVGQSNVDELVKAGKREALIRRRDLIKERLLEIENELEELEKETEEAAVDQEDNDDMAVEDRSADVMPPVDDPVDDPLIEEADESVLMDSEYEDAAESGSAVETRSAEEKEPVETDSPVPVDQP